MVSHGSNMIADCSNIERVLQTYMNERWTAYFKIQVLNVEHFEHQTMFVPSLKKDLHDDEEEKNV